MAVLNQLLEEAIRRSTELTARAEAATVEATETLEGATALGSLAFEEAEALHDEMAEALEAIGHARAQVEFESDRASSALEELPARANTTQSAVLELLTGVREDVAALSDLRARLLSRVDQSTQEADLELRDLGNRVQELQGRLESRLTEAAAQVNRLRTVVDEGRTHLGVDVFEGFRFAVGARHLRNAIQALGQLGIDIAREFDASLHAVALVLGRNVVECLNHALESHNDAFMALRTGLTSESPLTSAPDFSETWVREALQPIPDAVAESTDLLQPAGELLEDSATSILQKAEKALTALEAIAGSLERAVPGIWPTTLGA